MASLVAQIDFEMIAEGGFDQLPLVFPQQAVVDEDADELFADGLVEQGGHDGGIDPAGEAADHLAIARPARESVAMACSTKLPIVQSPGAFADFVEEVLEDLLAARRVGDLGMKLHAVKRPRRVPGGGVRDRSGVVARATKSCRQLVHLIAVAHPDGRFFGQAVDERIVAR